MASSDSIADAVIPAVCPGSNLIGLSIDRLPKKTLSLCETMPDDRLSTEMGVCSGFVKLKVAERVLVSGLY